MDKYYETLKRIFENGSPNGMVEITKRVMKARNNFIKRKQVHKKIAEAFSAIHKKDLRAFAEVVIGNTIVRGLGCRELVEELRIDVERFFSTVRTGGENI